MESMIGLLNVASVKLSLQKGRTLKLLDWAVCVCLHAYVYSYQNCFEEEMVVASYASLTRS